MMLLAIRAKVLLVAWWMGMYLPPDRRVLERVILPQLAKAGRGRRVLFVGVRFYTRHYARLFREPEFVTMDADSHMRKHGARAHVVERLEHLGRCFPPRSFEAIVVNGVLGWGIDTATAAEAALDACADGLTEGGLLVLGVNERRPSTPDLAGLKALRCFEPVRFPDLETERLVVPTPFDEREHTFLFFRKRADGADAPGRPS